mmetsp:Transcript_42542/g.96304  ORF Transcript_42542/g.96304 Transcript_42542/m.96304 type:complete len:199 (+) Transcript_42542:52-648(+)
MTRYYFHVILLSWSHLAFQEALSLSMCLTCGWRRPEHTFPRRISNSNRAQIPSRLPLAYSPDDETGEGGLDASSQPAETRAPDNAGLKTGARSTAAASVAEATELRVKAAAADESDDDPTTEALVGMIQWYKDAISPLMAPACRFYPTCSSYGIESLRSYGPVKGLVLTGWRIMRCNPFGGKGYDPPQWPPPGWFAGK